jgi:uncharacterized protein (TIGR00251 family)
MHMLEIATRGDAVIVKVRVQPKASRDAIAGEHAGALKVAVTAAPEKGKANKAVVELLAKALGVAKSNVELVSGATSRDKVFAIRGATARQIEALARGGAGRPIQSIAASAAASW